MSGAKPKLLFVVTEDWFFCSHFKPMARAAMTGGFDVAVACRVRDHRAEIEALGCRVLPLDADRKSLNPVVILRTFRGMRQLISAESPDIVHLIALRSIIVGGIAARLAGVRRRVLALTGMGLLGAAESRAAMIARSLVRTLVRAVVAGPQAHFLFENRSDPALLGLDPDDTSRVTIVGGAGVDPDVFAPRPMPPHPPLRLAMIARMLWSKGADIAVEAVQKARAKGADITLSLYGAPDPANPKAISEATLKAWSSKPGIAWQGKIPQAEVSDIWARHHAAVLPSRGGEGLPRTLLEAAACGRLLLTTDVPGCRDLVRNGQEGLLVPPGNSDALADALLELVSTPARIAEMGAAARARILDGHTEEAVGQAVVILYRRMMSA